MARRGRGLQLLLAPLLDPARIGFQLKTVSGGFLLQTRDNKLVDELKIVTKRQPTPQ